MAGEDTFRQRFLDSHDRFQAAILEALRAEQEGLVVAVQAFGKLDELTESVEELKTLIMEQGEQIKALRVRLDNGGEPT